jgi:predicted Fe-Mo cluster-binding NifX family protein
MKLCIPSKTDDHNNAEAYDHFGSAPYFMICDTESGAVEVIQNNNAEHAHGMCQPMQALENKQIHAVVCRGMGARAVQRLNIGGVKVFVSTAQTVKGVLQEYQENQLTELTIENACTQHQCH